MTTPSNLAAAAVMATLACASARAQLPLYSQTFDAGPPPIYCGVSSPYALSYARAAGDVDGDGYDDVLYYGTALWLTGSCGVPFPPSMVSGRVVSGFDSTVLVVFAAPVDREACGAGDVDGDGDDDVLHATATAYGQLVVLSRTRGVIRTLTGSATDRFGESVDRAGDVDGDGFDDVLVSSRFVNGASPGRTEVFSGRTGAVIRTFVGNSGRNAGDLDADGVDDFVTTSGTSVVAHSGSTGGTLWTWPGFAANALADGAGDVDGDGFADVVVVDATTVSVWSGATGGGLYALPTPNPTAHNFGVRTADAAGDVDADGFDDVWLGAQLLWGATGTTTTHPGNTPLHVGIGDFNRDGRADWVGFGMYGSPFFTQVGTTAVNVETLAIGTGAAVRWTHGAACAGAGTSLPHAGLDEPPRYGSTLRFTVGGARPSATSVFHLGLPDSISLGILGVPECTLLVAPFFVIGRPTNAIGETSFSFALSPSVLPPDVEFSAQWIGLDPGGNALGVELSDAVRFIVGN